MTFQAATFRFKDSRRQSKLGSKIVKRKISEAQQLTTEQRLLIALKLSDATAVLQHTCSKKN